MRGHVQSINSLLHCFLPCGKTSIFQYFWGVLFSVPFARSPAPSQPCVSMCVAPGCEGVAAINTINSVMGVNLDTLRPEPTVEGYSTPGGYSYRAVKPIALAKVGGRALRASWGTARRAFSSSERVQLLSWNLSHHRSQCITCAVPASSNNSFLPIVLN